MPKTKKAQDKIEVEPGFEKRLANILKRTLNTPPRRQGDPPKRDKPKRKG